MKYLLRYDKQATDSDYGWEHQSLPIGNGWLGANIFGIVERERIQITENSLQNPGELGGLNNFAEVYLHFDHHNVTDYERVLCLNDGLCYTSYTADGVRYRREYFASYPDRALVVHLTATKPFDLRLEAVIPYIKAYAKTEGDGGGKSGSVTYEGNRVHLRGCMEYYNVRFAGQIAVQTDGIVTAGEDGLSIENAADVVIFMAVGTNYELRPEVFLEEDPKRKLRDFDPGQQVAKILDCVLQKGYDAVRESHLADYRALFERVELSLGEERTEPTDQLLARYGRGERIPYLEMVYFQFGRYLLISSSREGTLPANLQGVWNVHDHSPWGSGYWHNINVQMNYWPAFITNIAETFPAYAAFNAAFRPKAEELAWEYVNSTVPENAYGSCGWTVGTGVYPYSTEGPGGHSGPGTGGLTTKLFWDYYDFTRNQDILKDITYPALRGMSAFLTKTVRQNADGIFRAAFSASPEQTHMRTKDGWQYYHTAGCAFDQQMTWENGKDFLKTAELLGLTSDAQYARQKAQIGHYYPVRIGASGQIKEFEEEGRYGEIGEYHHRHISQLIGLYPGTAINRSTPAWLDAAKLTLTERGDWSTGWALAHRLNAWARIGDGDHAYKLLRTLIGKRTMENLWDFHPPFQIDGNFGGTSGIAEMLLQSMDGCISILPALPKAWPCGQFRGLVARGAFEVSVAWENGYAKEIEILSKVGGPCVVSYPGIEKAALAGVEAASGKDHIRFDTKPGMTYRIICIPACAFTSAPKKVRIRRNRLTWKAEQGVTYRVYRNVGDAPDYKLLTETRSGSYCDADDLSGQAYVMYKVTAQRHGERESDGAVRTVCRADGFTRYQIWKYWIKCKKTITSRFYDFGLNVGNYISACRARKR